MEVETLGRKSAHLVVCVIRVWLRNVCFGLSAWSLVGKKWVDASYFLASWEEMNHLTFDIMQRIEQINEVDWAYQVLLSSIPVYKPPQNLTIPEEKDSCLL